jgi:hypothetical protein
MTGVEYAAHAGVSPAAVSKWISQGKIPPACLVQEKCSDGKIRRKILPDLADAELSGSLSESKRRDKKAGGRPPGTEKKKTISGKKAPKIKAAGNAVKSADDIPEGIDADMSLADAQRLKEIFKAATAQVEYLERRGKFANKKELQGKYLVILRQTVTDLQALPRKSHIIAELVSLTNPEAVEDLLAKTIFDLLSDLADTVEGMEKDLGL